MRSITSFFENVCNSCKLQLFAAYKGNFVLVNKQHCSKSKRIELYIFVDCIFFFIFNINYFCKFALSIFSNIYILISKGEVLYVN